MTQSFIDTAETRRLSVRVASSFASAWLVPRLASFVHQHPDIQIQIVTDNTQAHQKYECEIRYGHGKWPGMRMERLWAEKLRLLVAPNAIHIQSAAEIDQHVLIYTDSRVHGWAELLQKYRIALPVNSSGLHFDRTTLALEAAKAGLGIALESTLIAQRAIRDGLLKRVLDDVEIEDEAYYLVCGEGPPSDAFRKFRDWLFQQLESRAA